MWRLIRIALLSLSFLLLLLLAFYFWGSSSNYDALNYNTIHDYIEKEEAEVADTFTVVTYNIGYLSGMNNNISVRPDRDLCEKNLQDISDVFKKLHPTFIGFQEIDFFSKRSFFNNQMDSIATNAKFEFGAVAINWDKKYVPFPYWPPVVHFGRMLSGQSLLSRFPVTLNRRIVLPKPPSNPFYYNAFYPDRLIQITEVDIYGRSLLIFNVHLEAFDKEAREQQAEILASHIREYVDQYPLIVIGDFNCRPPFNEISYNSEKTIRTILGISGMVTAVNEEVYMEDPKRYLTFSSDKPYEKLDYIFYNTRFITKLEVRTLHEAGIASDHLPVYMKFILNDGHRTFEE